MGWLDFVASLLRKAPPPPPEPPPAPLGSLTLAAYWMGRDVTHAAELNPGTKLNAAELLARVNRLLGAYGKTPAVSSGWRPPEINASTPGASRNSRHMTGQAVDLADPTGILKQWCVTNVDLLQQFGLWMEAPSATPTWCHLQSTPPGSGKRIFSP